MGYESYSQIADRLEVTARLIMAGSRQPPLDRSHGTHQPCSLDSIERHLDSARRRRRCRLRGTRRDLIDEHEHFCAVRSNGEHTDIDDSGFRADSLLLRLWGQLFSIRIR